MRPPGFVELRSGGDEFRESNSNGNANVSSTRSRDSNALDKGGASLIDKPSHSSELLLSPAPICRKFWQAGNYEVGLRQDCKAANLNNKNHLRVHPMFLHSNATSHKWVFGAIAELVDNAVDEIQNGATFVIINKVSNSRDGRPALLIQDNGRGMGPEGIRSCMSFGFTKKTKHSMGQYGNGFKTSTMRLGADVIVFSRHVEMSSVTQSVGLLSYTFLRQTGNDRIVVPMVDYEFNTSTETLGPLLPHGKEGFHSNLSMLLQWSPYSTEEELLKQFDEIGHQGTKIIIYDLWLDDDGNMELDFDSHAQDIRISGDPNFSGSHGLISPTSTQHIAHAYCYSLRVYLSILYLRLPESFKIKLRGQIVERHNIADDLKFHEFIQYRPHKGGSDEAVVVTTIGFLKEAPALNIHGFSVYYRNRLILPFWRVLKNTTNSNGRGVVGVLEANFIQPTHNKQDFEKTTLFQKLEDRLKQMTLEYWHLHCKLLGYKMKKSPPAALPHLEPLTSRSHASLEQPMPSNYTSTVTDCRGDAFTVDALEDVVIITGCRSATTQGSFAESNQIRMQKGIGTKRKEHDAPATLEYEEDYIADTHYLEARPYDRTKNLMKDQEAAIIMKENKRLHVQLSELEKNVECFNLKVQQLQSELKEVHSEYTMLLADSKSMDWIDEQRLMMGFCF